MHRKSAGTDRRRRLLGGQDVQHPESLFTAVNVSSVAGGGSASRALAAMVASKADPAAVTTWP